jgi:hypothetical protein
MIAMLQDKGTKFYPVVFKIPQTTCTIRIDNISGESSAIASLA